MNTKTRQAARLGWLMAATAAAALMAGCGGGSSNDSAPSPAPAPAPVPAPAPAPTPAPAPVATDRIEPYDTGDTVPKRAALAVRALGSGDMVARVALGPVAEGVLPTQAATQMTKASQIGVARDVPALASASDLSALLRWTTTPRGTRVAALSVTSQGAKGVRLGLVVRSLPGDAVLRFYAQAGAAVTEVTGAEVMATIERNLQAGAVGDVARTYWSPDFDGPETTVEVEIPAASPTGSVVLALPRLSHYVVSPDDVSVPGMAKVGESGSCEVDVMCHPDSLSQSRSVARMTFVSEGKSYLCTGTLLNDARSSGTPYLLSAHHCISRQVEASSLISDWFYRASACDSGVLGPGRQRLSGGATLLHATSATDTSFMRLNDAPPAGVVYAGSYFGTMETGHSMVGVHHPRGDLQKVSAGIMVQFSTCADEVCSRSDQAQGTFLTMGWNLGVTEGGSSGSGLFQTIDSKRYLVGQLYGGASSCQAPAGQDQYGRFDVAYRNALKQWLNP